jgi:hypothetical protein
MATDVDDDDDKGNVTSLTGCNKGDNRNRDDSKDACASVHQRQLRLHIGDGDDTASREAAARQEAEAVRRDAM